MATAALKFIVLATAMTSCLAFAQVNKCLGKDGKYTYTEGPCESGSKSGQSLNIQSGASDQPAPAARAQNSGGSPAERELRGKIAAHLSRGDFSQARELAITQEHHAMIKDAEREKATEVAEKKAAKRAARPVICTTTGYAMGNAAVGTTYSGNTFCTK